MRVYAPRRCVGQRISLSTTYYKVPSSGYYVYGSPIEGDLADVPSYFRQVASNQKFNDVVHAKIVDQIGFELTKLDQTAGGYPYPQVLEPKWIQGWGGKDVRYLSVDFYHTEHQQILVDPGKNYKGKKPKQKPYTKDINVRVNHGFGIRIVPFMNGELSQGKIGRVNLFPEVDIISGSSTYDKKMNNKAHRVILKWTSSFGSPVRANTPIPNRDRWYWLAETWSDELESLRSRMVGRPLPEAKEALADLLERLIRSNAERIHAIMVLEAYQEWYTSWPCTNLSMDAGDLSQAFLLHETESLVYKLDPLVLGREGGTANYWKNYLCEHALLQACESLPRLSDNSIQNLIEVIGFVKSAVIDRRIEMPKSLADAWLAYRYQYGTGKLDVEDAIKFVHRHVDLGTLARQIVGRGTSTTSIKGVDILCRCQVDVTPKEVNILNRIWRALDTYGLTPDFYVIWDSIPYSFMVDWFLPISDIARVGDANTMYFSGEFYKLDNLGYSITYTREFNGFNVKCYSRWAGAVPSSLNSFYWWEPPSAGSKTVAKRVLDAGAIFIGR